MLFDPLLTLAFINTYVVFIPILKPQSWFPSVGLLRGVLPWDRLVTLVRERDRLLTRDRLEASGLLGGSISGEVDHQWFGLDRAFVSRLHAHMLLPLACATNFKPALIHYPLQ